MNLFNTVQQNSLLVLTHITSIVFLLALFPHSHIFYIYINRIYARSCEVDFFMPARCTVTIKIVTLNLQRLASERARVRQINAIFTAGIVTRHPTVRQYVCLVYYVSSGRSANGISSPRIDVSFDDLVDFCYGSLRFDPRINVFNC